MKLEGIINISGKSELFKIISQNKSSIIVESITTKKRIPIYSHTQANALEEISIYTNTTNIPLIDVFKIIFETENGGKCISEKSEEDKLKLYFTKIVPNYDQNRVYPSDIKKILKWYNSLHECKIINNPITKKNDKN